jgi:hypothetical protein
VSESREPRSSSRNYLIAFVIPVVLVAAVSLTFLFHSSPKTSPAKALCTALTYISENGKKHPPKHTYPDLKASLIYDHAQFASVTSAPAAIAGPTATATKSSAALLDDIALIQSKVKLSKARLNAAINDIKVWKKANAALAKWQKATCK